MAHSDIAHCLDKIGQLVESGADSRRDIFQLGYNLGRLSELTGLGRTPFWDAWKDPINAWDQPLLEQRLADLRRLLADFDEERSTL